MAKKQVKTKSSIKKKNVVDDDVRLWETVVEDVTPLDPRAKNIAREVLDAEGTSAQPAPPSKKPAPKIPAPQRRAASAVPAPPPPPPELRHGTVAGLDKRTAERMKRGQLKSEGRLDLHGLTQDEAHRALNAFIQAAYAAGKRQVMIITGKGESGTGVLKSAVPRWMNQAGLRDKIVAFDYAQPKHGGEGALYVRLHKPKGASK